MEGRIQVIKKGAELFDIGAGLVVIGAGLVGNGRDVLVLGLES